MNENPGRLNLIQRAAERLRMAEPAAVAADAAPLDLESKGMHRALDGAESVDFPAVHPREVLREQPPVRETLREAPAREAPFAETYRPAAIRSDGLRPVQLKFNEIRRRGMLSPDSMRSSLSFEFRAIKRKLLANARDPGSNVVTNNMIMVTSALPGEGKTFTAANLAFSLAAERDLHVLLVDADVIHPSIGSLFDSPEGPGLTDLLNGNCHEVSDIVRRCTDIQNMSVIFAGARDERTPELISSKRTAEIFADISKRYSNRVVVFDTPPVLASAETANLAIYMHQVVMVVAQGESNRAQVQLALDNVAACRNVNLVFNKAPKWHKVSSDSYYYYGEDRAG